MATLAVPASSAPPHVASLRSSSHVRQDGRRAATFAVLFPAATCISNCSLLASSLQETRGISSSSSATQRSLQGREGKQQLQGHKKQLQNKKNSAIKTDLQSQPLTQQCETWRSSSRWKQRGPASLGWLKTSAAVPLSLQAFGFTRRSSHLSKRPNSIVQANTGPNEPHVANLAWVPDEELLELVKGQALSLESSLRREEEADVNDDDHLVSKLPSHPKLHHGCLENGLQFVILPNKVPPNRFEAHMEMHVGSVDEEEHEQGIAHMIEHVAFLGSKKREKLLGTGARSNAYTDFHHTVFHVHSPVTTQGTNEPLLPLVLEALHEIAFKPKFLASRVEKEPRAVLSEQQMMNTIEYRVDCQLLQQLHSENMLGYRFPIGLEEQIKKWDPETIKAFHERWYFPANATLFIVGDIGSVSRTLEMIEAQFGSTPAGVHASTHTSHENINHTAITVTTRKERHSVRPPVRHTWSLPGARSELKKPFIFQHELLQNFSISLFCKTPVQKVQRYSDLRDVLMRQIVLSTFQFRVNTRYKSANPPFSGIELDHSDSGREGCAVSTLTITAEPKHWEGAIRVGVQEVRRLHKFGVTKGELARYLTALLKDSEHLAAMIDNVPSVDNLDFIMESDALGHTVMDQQQGHESLLAVDETITLEDVNKAGAAMLEYIATYGQPTAPIPAAIVACVPKTMHLEEVGDVSFDITPDAIVNAITVGLNEPLASEPELEVPTELVSPIQLASLHMQWQPRFVAVTDVADARNLSKYSDEATGVVQRRLPNGIRVNYKITQNEAKGGVLRLVVAGGRAQEKPGASGAVAVGVRTLSEGGAVGSFSREQVELFCVGNLINCVLEANEEFLCMDFCFTLRDGGMRATFQLLHMVLEVALDSAGTGAEDDKDLLNKFLETRTGNRVSATEGRVRNWRKQNSGKTASNGNHVTALDPVTHRVPRSRSMPEESAFSSTKNIYDRSPVVALPQKMGVPETSSQSVSGMESSSFLTQKAELSEPIREILHIANNLPQNHSLEDYLVEFTHKISVVEGNLVLKVLGEDKLFMQALSFFQWMRLHKPCLLDSRSFSIIFNLLGKAKMIDEALALYRSLPSDKTVHSVKVYNTLLTALSNCDRHEEIFAVLEQMQATGTEPDSVTFSILITEARKGKDGLHKVLGVYRRMMERGVKPDVTAFGSLIKAFCDTRHPKEALLAAIEMERLGMPLNVIIYNTLIDAYGKVGELEEMEGLVVEMKERGLEPNKKTFNILIHCYGCHGQYKVAEALMLEIEAAGFKPDVVTFTALIGAYGKQKMSEKAASVFNRMRNAGVTPNAYSYTALINAYSEGHWHEKAAMVFERMRQDGISPSVETYTALLDGYRRAGNIEMVKEVWKTMREENCAGTRVTFVTLVDAFAKQGLLRDARDVIFEFEKLGHKPDLMIYNMLLNAYCRGGNHRKGPEILHEIRSAGLKPDSFSYCTLIYAFLRVRDFAKAYKYHEEMLKKGKSPDTKTYAKLRAILKVSLRRKQVNDQKANAGQTPRQGSLGKIPENAKSFWKRGKRPSRRLLR